jgi:tetratricopeptide (TPR) repeat protein
MPLPPVPQTGRTPGDPSDPRLLPERRDHQPGDLFANDPHPDVRAVGRLVLRRRRSSALINDLLALGDICARQCLAPDGRLRIYYLGKALLAYRRAAIMTERVKLTPGDAQAFRQEAQRIIDALIAWTVAAADELPLRRNIAVALWAAAEYDDPLQAQDIDSDQTISDIVSSDEDYPSLPLDAPPQPFSDLGVHLGLLYLGNRSLDAVIARLLGRYRDLLTGFALPNSADAPQAATDASSTRESSAVSLRPRPSRDGRDTSAELDITELTDIADAPNQAALESILSESVAFSETRAEPAAPGWVIDADPADSAGAAPELADEAANDAPKIGSHTDVLRQGDLALGRLLESDPDARADTAAPDDEFGVGSLIDARYEVVSIKRGGMGVVYLCYDRHQRESVAIKSFQSRFFNNDRARARFEQEALTWFRLEKHRHIVQARRVEKFDGRPHLILEHVSGPEGLDADLRSWIERKRLTLPLVVKFGLHIALGMQHAVAKMPGLVHRDLKPANILVTHDEIAKVTDFGLVRSVDGDSPTLNGSSGDRSGEDMLTTPPLSGSAAPGTQPGITGTAPASGATPATHDDEPLTRVGALVGTLPYMSPEQCQAKPVDLRSDIYAFGCLLYEMLTGSPVFPARRREAWLYAHMHERPAFAPPFDRALPDELRALVLRCLEKRPDARPASWGALVEGLAAVYQQVTGEPAPLNISGIELEALELMDKAYSLTELGRAEEALLAYDRAISLQPGSSWAWARKARALRLLNRCEEALLCYEEALRLDPANAWALKGKGIVLERLGDLAGALDCHQQATRLNPADVWHWHNQGDVLHKMGRYSEAVALLQEAIRIDPNHAQSWGKLGQTYRLMRDYNQALAAYERALECDPKYAWAHNGCGLTLKAVGEYDRALMCFKRAARYDPQVVWHWYNVTEMLVDLGQYEEALPPAREAVRISPDHVSAWGKLGQVLRYLKRYEEALAAYERAITLKPNFAWAHNGKGIIYEQLGRYDEALACYRQAAQSGTPDASHAYNQGNILALLGRLDEAEPLLRHAVELKPDFARAWARLGGVLRTMERLQEAITALQRALDLDETSAWAWSELARALETLGQRADADAAQRRAVESKPDHAVYLTQHADTLFNRGSYLEALDVLDQALKLDPRSPRAWARRGQVLRRLSRLPEALRSYERALDLDPRYAWAWAGRAMAELALNQVDDALDSFSRAIDLDPDDVWYRYTLGDTLVTLNRFADAVEVLAGAVRLEPTNADIWAKLGQAYRRLERHTDALAAYDKALAIRNDHAWAWNGRGLSLEELERREEAAESYRRALALDRGVIWYYTNLVDLLLGLHQHDEALTLMDEALRALPENPVAWARHGQVLRRSGDFDSAIYSYRKALDLDPTYAWAWNGLGLSYAALGQWSPALECYREAVRFNPDDVWFWYNFGDALLTTGERKSAAAIFERALALDPSHEPSQRKLRQARGQPDE